MRGNEGVVGGVGAGGLVVRVPVVLGFGFSAIVGAMGLLRRVERGEAGGWGGRFGCSVAGDGGASSGYWGWSGVVFGYRGCR